MTDRSDRPKSHEDLDAILSERLMGMIDQLLEEHGISVVAVCSVRRSDLVTVVTSMTPHEATTSMSAALFAYEADARENRTILQRLPS